MECHEGRGEVKVRMFGNLRIIRAANALNVHLVVVTLPAKPDGSANRCDGRSYWQHKYSLGHDCHPPESCLT